jgi:predicted  nucleic acid-binding Zn-ribbon protein
MTALDKSISDINTAIGADTTTGTIKGRIKVLEGEMDAVEKRATDLETDVSELQTAATDHGTRIGTLESEMDAVEGRMDIAEGDIDKVENRATNLETRATNIENAIGTDTTEGTIKGRITAAEGDISGLSTNVTNIWSSLGKSDTESGTVRYRVKAVENAIGTDTTAGTVKYRIKTLETEMDAVEKRADNVEKAIGADDIAGSVKGRITELEGDVSSLTDNITKNYATKTELSNVNTTLTNKINDEIKAVNAMSYKNGVSAWSQLPTSNATNKVPKVGDTYVVTEAFERTVNNVTTYYQPGDLLVASGTETGTGKDAYITSNLAWNHVKTGYDIELDPNLTVANNIIYLKNYNNEDLGNIKIQSSTNNLKVSTSGNTISFNLEWDTFDPVT